MSRKALKRNTCFLEKCSQIAKQKKIMENALKYSKTSKTFLYPSMLKKTLNSDDLKSI